MSFSAKSGIMSRTKTTTAPRQRQAKRQQQQEPAGTGNLDAAIAQAQQRTGQRHSRTCRANGGKALLRRQSGAGGAGLPANRGSVGPGMLMLTTSSEQLFKRRAEARKRSPSFELQSSLPRKRRTSTRTSAKSCGRTARLRRRQRSWRRPSTSIRKNAQALNNLGIIHYDKRQFRQGRRLLSPGARHPP